MKKTRYKRILGLFILTFVILFGGTLYVAAAECKIASNKTEKSCQEDAKEMDTPSYFKGRYKFKDLDIDDDGYYVLTNELSGDLGSVKKKNIKFKIKRLYTYNLDGDNEEPKEVHAISDAAKIKKAIVSTNKDITAGSTIKISRTGDLNDSATGFMVVLELDGFEDPAIKACCLSSPVFELGLELQGGAPETRSLEGQEISAITLTSSKQIDCDNYADKYTDKKSFNYQFCYAKDMAGKLNQSYDFGTITDGKTYLAYGNKFKKDSERTLLKCDYATMFDSQEENVLKDDSKYYVESNKSYFYGSGEYQFDAGTYIYNYEKNAPNPVKEAASCTIECEESVVVEYGTPIASKAGLCFEYKVKVTSRVACGLKDGTTINVPKEAKYCTPRPLCVHSGGVTYKQGGPNDEFDSCINNCDGGKYTDKCVTKCYNSIYNSKKTSTKQADTMISYETVKLAEKPPAVMSAPKYKYSGGKIIWDTGQTGDNQYKRTTAGGTPPHCVANSVDSVWHKTNSWGTSACSKYTMYHTTGIPKTETCTDSCSWRGCTGDNIYLNQKQAEDDYKYNKSVYDDLKSKCEAAASCSSTTAEFTMSVDYINGATSKSEVINFPYTSNNAKNKDKLPSYGKDNKNATGTASQSNSTIIKYAGCYKSEDEKNWYQTEWTFPGTWVNNKTHEISFVPVNDSAWRVHDKEFCIPLNAKDVNQKWWTAYYAKLYGSNSNYAVNNPEYLSEIECENASSTSDNSSSNSNSTVCDYGNTEFTTSDAKDITWNIHARSNKFGYFGWYIKVDCFYSLYQEFNCRKVESNDTANKGTTKNGSNSTKCGDLPYRVRSVDLKNVFPGSSDKKLTNYESTGRSPGFNWTEYASQITKDTDYQSNPEKYTKWIQENGYSVYSDKYLDYYIYLSKDDISNLKKKNIDYTSYKGKVDTNSVTNYKSDLIRGGKDITTAYYPNEEDALKCNNIDEHSTGAPYSADCVEYK